MKKGDKVVCTAKPKNEFYVRRIVTIKSIRWDPVFGVEYQIKFEEVKGTYLSGDFELCK